MKRLLALLAAGLMIVLASATVALAHHGHGHDRACDNPGNAADHNPNCPPPEANLDGSDDDDDGDDGPTGPSGCGGYVSDRWCHVRGLVTKAHAHVVEAEQFADRTIDEHDDGQVVGEVDAQIAALLAQTTTARYLVSGDVVNLCGNAGQRAQCQEDLDFVNKRVDGEQAFAMSQAYGARRIAVEQVNTLLNDAQAASDHPFQTLEEQLP